MTVIRRKLHEGGWDGVDVHVFQDGTDVEKHALILQADGCGPYQLASFRVPAGGYTSRQRMPHDHGMYFESGRARGTVGDATHEVRPGDVPVSYKGERFRVEPIGNEPAGFLCVKMIDSDS